MTSFRPAARPSRRGRWVFLAITMLLPTGGGAAWLLIPGLHPARPDLVLHKVKHENLLQTIVERGEMQSADNRDIACQVNHEALCGSKTTIKWVIEDGTKVKKGDKLLELDSAKLEDLKRTQGIARDKAENDYIFAEATLKGDLKDYATQLATAKRAVAVARLGLDEYRDGTYPQTLKDYNSQILQAEADLEQNKDYTAYVDRMVNKKFMSQGQAQAAHAKLLGSELNLSKLNEQKRVLVNYTGPKETQTRQGVLDDAIGKLEALRIVADAKETQDRNDAKTKKAIFDQEQKKYDEIQKEILKCVVTAPQNGLVIYYQSVQSRRGSGSSQSIIAENEPVTLNQKLMQMPDLDNMLVNTRIHEALVSKVHPGQRVKIRPHSFPGVILDGRVKSVANVAAQQDWFSSDVKVYEAMIEIQTPIEGLKPGMSAVVTISTDVRASNVLAVPIQAIVRIPEKGAKFKVFVKTPTGIEEKMVEVGISDEKMVEIKSGLNEGDEVVLNVDVLQGGKSSETAAPRGREGYPGGGVGGPGKSGGRGPKGPGGAGGRPGGGGPGQPGGGGPRGGQSQKSSKDTGTANGGS
jgi:multidrug efflux pump subunit AcrA (membrane-fusion protein)